MKIKIYLLATLILLLFFILTWSPYAQIDLLVSSEPLNYEFKVNLDSQSEKIFFNLDILPAKIILPEEKNNFQDYVFLQDLYDENKNQLLIFKKSDLEKLVEFRIKPLIKKDKRVFNFRADHWQIVVEERDPNLLWANVNILVKEEIIYNYNLKKIREEMIFENIKSAQEKLNALPELKENKISLWPRFLKRLPIFKERIKISLTGLTKN